ncbi:MAG: sigma-54 dependent transcriptional regulator, partial [Gammaproteobacteria bacterium]|nr:sigma-54 dependent transcriptional regulator [Gammaproteobacteria bacterium]
IRDQGDIIGDDPVLLDTLDKARQSAKTDASVLLIGESGTGKERFAGFIHTNSHRSKEPFVALNCAAIPENLIESELFGHEKGAFTGAEKLTLGKFEAANGGTLFLDEIGDLGPEIQAKLLRVLQESEVLRLGSNTPIKVDVRIVAATHKDIQREISKGKFRLDLFYRLNVITLKLPALRDRKDDIVLLLEYFLSLSNQKYKKRCYFSKHAIQALKNYLWPGNIRQLENLVERSVILSDGDELGPEILDNEMLELDESGSIAKSMDSTFPSRPYQSVHKINRESIINAVRSASGNKTQAAKNLGLSSRQLHYRIQKLGIEAEDLDDLCIF